MAIAVEKVRDRKDLAQRIPAGVKAYAPRGAALRVFYDRSPEIVMDGPAGTGKSRAILEKLHLQAEKYPGMRGLIVRKTRSSLTQTAIVTFTRHVLPPGTAVRFHTPNQEFRYPNGSIIAIGGLDKDIKIMSAEYDTIAVIEAIELLEADWEAMTTRLRNNVLPYQQILADCNPGAPSHWIKQRHNRGGLVMYASKHRDNPVLWDAQAGAWTAAGTVYLDKLRALTGVRRDRLYKGLWVQAEGAIYDTFDRDAHIIDRFEIPADWPRYWSIDFGFTNPFVWQAWALTPDNELIRYREIYRTGRLVEDHAADIAKATTGEPRPVDIFADHDAEGRATLERHLGVITTPANKKVQAGIQAVQKRLQVKANGRPGIFFMRDSLVEVDPELQDRRLPTCTEEEIEGYVRKKGSEDPVKENDHGLDAARYLVAGVDDIAVRRGPAEVADFNVFDI